MSRSYRVYSLDGFRILKGDWLDAASDQEAIAAARSANPGSKCEVWEDDRLVAKFGAAVPTTLSARDRQKSSDLKPISATQGV